VQDLEDVQLVPPVNIIHILQVLVVIRAVPVNILLLVQVVALVAQRELTTLTQHQAHVIAAVLVLIRLEESALVHLVLRAIILDRELQVAVLVPRVIILGQVPLDVLPVPQGIIHPR
jgi:hypothetical protein